MFSSSFTMSEQKHRQRTPYKHGRRFFGSAVRAMLAGHKGRHIAAFAFDTVDRHQQFNGERTWGARRSPRRRFDSAWA
jgi:hypothetical protein